MNSRERLTAAIHHQQPDRVPFDLGATSVTGIHALALYRLRKALKLPERPIKVYEVLQQLGLIEPDDIARLKIDVCGIMPYTNIAGDINDRFTFSLQRFGIPILYVAGHKTTVDTSGKAYIYPQGDLSAPPSMTMPAGGYFFDNINRSPDTCDDRTDPVADFLPSFGHIREGEAEYYYRQVEFIINETDLGVIGNLAPAGFGDVAFLPGPNLKYPRGIRSMEEWIIAHKLYPEYIHAVFTLQLETALKNLEIYRQAVGDAIQVIFMGGTDFGTQISLMQSKEDFRTFYKPYWKKVNRWVHENTSWKTFYHSCGAVYDLLDEFIDAGVDILNPVQCSAAGMDAANLKHQYGEKLVFWGGGMDTQRILPFGTPEQVRELVRERIEIFSPGGGFVFNAIHNIQANTPTENIVAMIEALREIGGIT